MRAASVRRAVLTLCRDRLHRTNPVRPSQHFIGPTMQLAPTPPSGSTSTLPLSLGSSASSLPSFSSMAHPTGPPSSTPLPYIPLTLVLCLRPSPLAPSSLQLLLGLKKRGFGAGRYNGFGGKLQHNETTHQAAKRELHEECGLLTQHLDDIGVIVQRFVDRPDKLPLVIHVMQCRQWEGDVVESDEMAPVWVEESEVPYERMWADDRYWYGYVFRGQSFVADYVMEGMERVVDGSVEACSVEQLRQWSWERHSSEQWRATVEFDKQHRAGSHHIIPAAQSTSLS